LRVLGMVILARPGEYGVNFRGGKDDTAYYAEDL
jgi:hypothetical protein